jgi:hypothetical protein
MTPLQAARYPEAVREFRRIDGPAPHTAALLDAITASAKSDMGERYDRLNAEWVNPREGDA